MAIRVTRIGDVFKQKVTESLDVPTIWVDLDGNEHEDYEHLAIASSRDVNAPLALSNGFNLSVYGWLPPTDMKILTVNGVIKQVGSHVLYCGKINDMWKLKYPFDLSKTFKAAKNLKSLAYTFHDTGDKDNPITIPEDLLWGCPNLIECNSVFSLCFISQNEIPENLFSKCPKLKSIESCFQWCYRITKIPDHLFKNNTELINLSKAFSRCDNLQDIPKGLLDPFRRGFLEGTINLDHLFYMSPDNQDVTMLKERVFTSKIPNNKLKKLFSWD